MKKWGKLKLGKQQRICLPVLLAAVAFAIQPARADLLVNGDFEEPLVVGTGGFDNYTTGESFPGWTVGSGDVDIVRALLPGEEYQYGLHVWPAASGNQSVDLNGYHPGSIYQDVTTVAGHDYLLRFALAGNVIGNTPGNGIIVTMDFLWGGTSVQTLTFDTTGYDGYDFGWTYYQFQLTAMSDLSRLALRSLSFDTGARGPAIDDVSLVEVAAAPPPDDQGNDDDQGEDDQGHHHVPDVANTLALLGLSFAGVIGLRRRLENKGVEREMAQQSHESMSHNISSR